MTGEAIDGRYPEWVTHVPEADPDLVVTNLAGMLDVLLAAATESRQIGIPRPVSLPTASKGDEGYEHLDPQFLLDALKGARWHTGFCEVRFLLTEPLSPAKIVISHKQGQRVAVVMPCKTAELTSPPSKLYDLTRFVAEVA